MSDKNSYKTLLSLLRRNPSIRFAAKALHARHVLDDGNGLPGPEIREVSGTLWSHITRYCSGPGTQGTAELFDGLINAPVGSEVLSVWFEDDEHSYGVFSDTEASLLYGIVAVPKGDVEDEERDADGRAMHRVKVMYADGTTGDATAVSWWTRREEDEDSDGYMDVTFHIELTSRDETFRGEGGDYFDAMADLRGQLEPMGLKLLCFGARRDTWASGMARSMGSGDRAYLLSYPRTEFKPMQSIWDYAPPETIGTVEEQEAYCDAFDRERMKGKEE